MFYLTFHLDLSIMNKHKLTSANWCKFDSKQRQIVITHEINGINPLNRVQFVKDSIETIQFGLNISQPITILSC